MQKTCLCIIFNHKFNKNIPILESFYKDKFEKIYYIVPFNNESINGIDESRIITVYETSYCFQGYIAQAYEKIKNKNYTHYVFVGDDQILNPLFTGDNITEMLGIKEDESFIKNIIPYGESIGDRSNKLYEMIAAFRINVGVSWKNELPSYEEVAFKAKQKGLDVTRKLSIKQLISQDHLKPKYWGMLLNTIAINKGLILPYPFYKSYADMIILDQNSMDEFCRLSGIFAAMNLFVETAIPIAMVIACKKIKLEKDLNGWHGIEYWDKDIPIFENRFNHSINSLFENFDSKAIYYHPVKLSRWQ